MKPKEGPLSPDANPLFSDPATIPGMYWEKIEHAEFHGGQDIRQEGDVIRLSFLGFDCAVDRLNRKITVAGFPCKMNFQAYLVILSYLGSENSKPLSGSWCLARELKGGIHFFDKSHPLTVDRVIEKFRDLKGGLERAFITLGGRKLDAGDIGYELTVLPGIRVRYIYWEGDEEFAPALTVNFQKDVTDVLAPDVIWAMVNVVNNALIALGG